MFNYGQRIEGMSSADDVTVTEPLETGIWYRLSIAAGKIKGQLDFHIGPAPANTVTNR